MATRSKHKELAEEVESLRAEVTAMSEKQALIQDQLDEVNGRPGKEDMIDTKVSTVKTLVLKSSSADRLVRLPEKVGT